MKHTKIRQLYGYFTAAALALAAICLIVGCVSIYRSGEFTPQAVASTFRPIAVPVYLAVILSLGSAGMALLYGPAPKEKLQRCKPSPLPKAFPGWVRYGVLGAALGLVAFGYFTGGIVDVLTKAVNICTECVGLG